MAGSTGPELSLQDLPVSPSSQPLRGHRPGPALSQPWLWPQPRKEEQPRPCTATGLQALSHFRFLGRCPRLPRPTAASSAGTARVCELVTLLPEQGQGRGGSHRPAFLTGRPARRWRQEGDNSASEKGSHCFIDVTGGKGFPRRTQTRVSSHPRGARRAPGPWGR